MDKQPLTAGASKGKAPTSASSFRVETPQMYASMIEALRS